MALVGFYLIVGVGILVGGVFAIDPSLDLQVARYFTQQDTKDILVHLDPLVQGLRLFNFQLTLLVLALTGTAVIVKIIRPDTTMLLPARSSVFVILVFALGPALLANGILKMFWGRPRPRMLTEFGGTHNFMAWWDTSGTCISNCSFVSGEASSAFAVFALAALVPSPWRYPAIGMAILYGASVGLIRMAVGAHFLSDVLFAGVFIALLVWVLHGLFWRWKATAIPETVAEQRIGNTLRNLAMIRKAAIQGITNFVRGLMMRMVWKQPQQLPVTQTVAPATSGQALQQ